MTYFANGNVQSANDTANGNWVYSYDDFNRLISSTGGPNNYTYTYDYDRFGNRWNQKLNGGCTAGTAACVQFDANNRMTNLVQTYDAAGNVLSDSANTYAYDAENRLVSLDSGATTYGYDADGQRVFKTTAGALTDFIYDREGHIIVINPATPALTELYVGGMHLVTKALNSAGTDTDTYFNHADWLGTERARTDVSGNLCETITSLPFGDGETPSTTCAEGDVSAMHFTGKERDVESGLDYFGARFYSSNMARFMSPDWAAKPTAVPYAMLGDPQTLNLYTYVENSPVDRADLDGHQSGGCPNNQQMFNGSCVTLPQNGNHDPHQSPCVKDSAGNCSNNPTTTGAPPDQTDQNHSNQTQQRGFDKNKAAAYMNNTGAKGYNKYGGHCARACHAGLHAGGIDISDRPQSGLAKDNGPFLMRHGFKAVANGVAAKGLPSGYKPETGDTAVFQGGPHHTSGHMEMYDGKQWDSDTHQPRFAPDRNYPGTYTIYRYPD